MKTSRSVLAGVALLSAVQVLLAADLEPPLAALSNGAPVAFMKSLEEIEPRALISSLPYVISSNGSYYVAGSLNGVANSNGIVVAAGEVIIDLNGFSLRGATNSLDGISVVTDCGNITIRNGAISGWGGFGIMATNASHLKCVNVNIHGCGFGGLYAGRNTLVDQCEVYTNGYSAPLADPPLDDGIRVGPYSTVKECKAYANKGAGIHTYSFSRVTGCIATESAMADGIHAEDYCVVRDCIVARNMFQGIKVGSMSRVADNTCGENGIASTNNGAGILVVGENSLIENNNTCRNCYGFRSQSSTADGSLIVRNSASNNTTGDYYFVAGDYYGEMLTPAPGNVINSNPWANFSIQ